ncbi:MAG: cupredoxin family protein [Pseudomonadota bacterium]
MHQVTPIAAALIAASMIVFVPAAFGHGGSGHGKPAAVDDSKMPDMRFGRAGNPRNADRTIHVAMNDKMQFVAIAPRFGQRTDIAPGVRPHAMPGDIEVKRGETVRFVVRNEGGVMHEMVIGTMKELKQHAALMRRHPEMEHDEPYMAHVAPGKEGEMTWQFTRSGEFHYACLMPGHMEAGMISKIIVK